MLSGIETQYLRLQSTLFYTVTLEKETTNNITERTVKYFYLKNIFRLFFPILGEIQKFEKIQNA